MTQIKAAFFDIDGTLLPFHAKALPESTVQALAALRKNGVKTFIATGRPPVELGAGDVAALIQHEDIYQLSAFLPPEKEAEFLRRCPGCLAVRWEDDFCDILPAGGGKPNGLAHTLTHLGLTREQSIAFGDGGNDVTMLEYAGIGVAMGNACDAAKAAADYVTDDITADGLAKALAHFGLI